VEGSVVEANEPESEDPEQAANEATSPITNTDRAVIWLKFRSLRMLNNAMFHDMGRSIRYDRTHVRTERSHDDETLRAPRPGY
jgi:hypothetical protein